MSACRLAAPVAQELGPVKNLFVPQSRVYFTMETEASRPRLDSASSERMSQDVYEKLAALGLECYAAPLADLGVVKLEDLRYLNVEDYADIGLNRVRTRMLQERIHDDDRSDQDVEEEDEPASRMANVATDGLHFRSQGKSQPSLNRSVSMAKRRQSKWWQNQVRGRPMRLVFVRHGESEANVDRNITKTVPDHMLHLTARGREQALEAGRRLKEIMGDESVKFVVSPWIRTKETLNGILRAWLPLQPIFREDVRIREQEYGNYDPDDIKELMKEKKRFGPFYYRFPDGESPADCYDRASSFIESLYRSWEDNTARNQVIVSHGMMLIVMIMRLFRIPIVEFPNFDNLQNCELIVLERPVDDGKLNIAYVWPPGQDKDFDGMRRKEVAADVIPVWDGDPEAGPLKNDPVREST